MTCLGLYLFEKLQKIYQKLKAEERTWELLLTFGKIKLKKAFEVLNIVKIFHFDIARHTSTMSLSVMLLLFKFYVISILCDAVSVHPRYP